MKDVTAFGEILIDFTSVDGGENGAHLFAQYPGGAPGNVCAGVSRLGGQSAFVGKIGTDMHGEFLKKVLEEEGIDVSNLVHDDSVFTTLAFVSVSEDGERQFSFARKPGADTQMSFEEMDLDLIRDSRIYHTGSLSLTHEPARTATTRSIEEAKKAGVMISYDPNYRASLWPDEQTAREQMRSLISQADIMKISDEETDLLTDHEEPEEAAKALLDQGVKIAAVTLGGEGCLVANYEGMARVPGFKSVVADTNGAGDSFWATMLWQISQSGKKAEEITLDELKQFGRFANAAAALTVRKHGAIPALPTRDEVEAFLETQN